MRGNGLLGDLVDGKELSPYLDDNATGLSVKPNPGRPLSIGSDRGFSWLGCLCSALVRDVGDASLADELKADFE